MFMPTPTTAGTTGAVQFTFADGGTEYVPPGVAAYNALGADDCAIQNNSQPDGAPSTDGAAGTAGASLGTADSPLDGFSSFSPESIYEYCESRLNSINGQAQQLFTEQQNNQAAIQDIQDCANYFKNYSTANQDNSQGNLTALEGELESTMQKVGDTVGEDSPAYAQLQSTLTQLKATDGDDLATNTELTSFSDNIGDAASDLNSDSELQMVQLQSLMSQRETAITLTTNLIQSIGDEENKVADNIGK
jgi:hypothetical protein